MAGEGYPELGLLGALDSCPVQVYGQLANVVVGNGNLARVAEGCGGRSESSPGFWRAVKSWA